MKYRLVLQKVAGGFTKNAPLLYILKLGAYSEPCQTCKMKRYANTVNDLNPLEISAKRSILDIW